MIKTEHIQSDSCNGRNSYNSIFPPNMIYADEKPVFIEDFKSESFSYQQHPHIKLSPISESQYNALPVYQPSSDYTNYQSIIKHTGQLQDISHLMERTKLSPIDENPPIVSSSTTYNSTPVVTLPTVSTSSIKSQVKKTVETTKKSGTRRPEKPAMSYINMIGQAIRESPNKKLTLSEIYSYLEKK